MTFLEAATTAYELAQAVQPQRHRVSSAVMREYSKAVQALIRALGDEVSLPLWEALVNSAKAARWRAAAEATPLSAPGARGRSALDEVVAETTRLEPIVDLGLVKHLRRVRDSANELCEEDNASLAQALLTCIADGDPETTCVVSCRGRTAIVTREWLTGQGRPRPVLTPRDFLRGQRWDLAVVVGPSDWYPSHMFTCPNASAMTLVHYSHVQDSQTVRGLFGAAATTPIAVSIRSDNCVEQADKDHDRYQEGAVEQLPQPEWSFLVEQATPRNAQPGEFQVAARLLALAGGIGLWLPLDATSIRGVDAQAPRGERILHLRADAVTPGAVLVVRENGTMSGTLAAMADAILGPTARRVRSRQHEWKGRLREELARVGSGRLEETLRRQGSTTANLRFWASEDNIRPRHDHDFVVLLRHLGFAEPAQYLADGRSLWSAHHRAGVRLTAALEDLIEKADLSELEVSGRQELQLVQAGVTATLTAVRVLAVDRQAQEVTLGATRRPFPLKGARWLE